jgi:hypothetical protein
MLRLYARGAAADPWATVVGEQDNSAIAFRWSRRPIGGLAWDATRHPRADSRAGPDRPGIGPSCCACAAIAVRTRILQLTSQGAIPAQRGCARPTATR